MKVGDLVRFDPGPGSESDARRIGTVINTDRYPTHRLPFAGEAQLILEVLWNTGHTGWILGQRIEVVR